MMSDESTVREGPLSAGNKPLLLMVANDSTAFRFGIAAGATASGFRVEVALPRGLDWSTVQSAGYKVHGFALNRRSMNPLREASSLASLIALYRRVRPNIVHHFTIKPVIYGGLAARIFGMNAVHTVTGLGHVFIASGRRAATLRSAVQRIYRAALGGSRVRIVFQNPDDFGLFVDKRLVNPELCRLVRGSGVDTDRLQKRPEPTGNPLVLLPARQLHEKGLAEFVKAAALVRQQYPAARFAVVGGPDPGNPSNVDPETIALWTSEGNVEFWGWRNELIEIMIAATVICLPSHREGLPRVLLEAAALGRAIVATDVPGCHEVVRAGREGILVPPNDPVKLARGILELLWQPSLRDRLRDAARIRVESEFSLRRIQAGYAQIYLELMKLASESQTK